MRIADNLHRRAELDERGLAQKHLASGLTNGHNFWHFQRRLRYLRRITSVDQTGNHVVNIKCPDSVGACHTGRQGRCAGQHTRRWRAHEALPRCWCFETSRRVLSGRSVLAIAAATGNGHRLMQGVSRRRRRRCMSRCRSSQLCRRGWTSRLIFYGRNLCRRSFMSDFGALVSDRCVIGRAAFIAPRHPTHHPPK